MSMGELAEGLLRLIFDDSEIFCFSSVGQLEGSIELPLSAGLQIK